MGEIADDIVDSMIGDCDWSFFDRRARRPAQIKTCNRCGEPDLRWGNVKGGGWRLHHTDGRLHECESNVERFYGG